MAACQYELQRQHKIAENKRRMEQLGLQQVCAASVKVDQKAGWSNTTTQDACRLLHYMQRIIHAPSVLSQRSLLQQIFRADFDV